jgi:hypothetical protein
LHYCFKSDFDSNWNNWTAQGNLYIDVVYIIDKGTKKFYQTIKNVYPGTNPLDDSTSWKEAPGYGTLLTENILITNDEGSISGGMLNKPTNNKTILWAGGEGVDTDASSKDAAFRVTEDGTLFATKGMFSGMYISKAKELQKFVVSRRIIPELVYYEEYETDKYRAVTPPVLDISELSDVLIFDESKFNLSFSDMPKQLCNSNGDPIRYPRYTYDPDTYTFTRQDVDLYINGSPVVYLPTGWYLPLSPSDKGNKPYDRLHHFLSVGNSGSISSETAESNDVDFDYSNIDFDAFFAYMISLTTPST